MKIVFFGGSGFLGSHVCDKLSDAGHDVTIVDLRPSPYLRPDQKMVTGSLLDEDLVNTVVSGADAVFDFAGLADIGESNQKPVETARINVLGNVILLEACRKAGVKRYVFASTLYVYGKSGGFYRCSKQACELYIENYHDMFGLEYTILRYGSLYGPRADRRNAINRFVAEALEKRHDHLLRRAHGPARIHPRRGRRPQHRGNPRAGIRQPEHRAHRRPAHAGGRPVPHDRGNARQAH